MGTILVLDDDAALIELLRMVVQDAGHTAIVARDLESISIDTHADLVLSDLMPLTAYSGDQARTWVTLLRARFDAPIVVITAHGAAADEPDRLGADEVIAKPFDVDALLARIEDHIRKTP